jgi:DNA-binding transcriptional LysR family regulator
MMKWFAEANVRPERVSTCNSLSVTLMMVRSGFGIGLIPVRVVAAELAQGSLVRVPVLPAVEAHRVWLCYQANQFGSSLQAVIDLTTELIAQHQLFT